MKQTKWLIKPWKYEANEIYEYSKDGNTVTVTDNLKWSSFTCTTEGNAIPKVNTHNIFQTPGEIESNVDDWEYYSHEVDTDGCDRKTSALIRKLQREELALDDALPGEGWECKYRVEVGWCYLTCLDGPNAGKRYNKSGTRVDENGNLLPDYFDEENEESEDENLPALHVAVREDNLDKVRELIAAGADVQATAKNGATPLMFAAKNGNSEVVKLLLDSGANVLTQDDYCWTPLLLAADSGSLEVVKLLLARGADVQTTDKDGRTALMKVAVSGNPEVVKLLLARGADVQAKDERGETALLKAVAEGNPEVVNQLLDAGADIQAKDGKGRTALMFAAEKGHTEAVRLLLDKGADVQAQNKDGETALMYAAEKGHTEAVRLLLDAGADIQAKIYYKGKTALTLAERNKHTEVIALLRAAADAAAQAPPKQQQNSQAGKEKAGTSSTVPLNTGETPTTGKLQDRVFLFTGKLSVLSRKEAEELVRSAGARAVSALSGKVTDLVAGEKAGSKLDQAKAQGIAVMSEADFIKLMQELGLYQG